MLGAGALPGRTETCARLLWTIHRGNTYQLAWARLPNARIFSCTPRHTHTHTYIYAEFADLYLFQAHKLTTFVLKIFFFFFSYINDQSFFPPPLPLQPNEQTCAHLAHQFAAVIARGHVVLLSPDVLPLPLQFCESLHTYYIYI